MCSLFLYSFTGEVELENFIWIIVGIVAFFSIVGVVAGVMCVCARAGFRPRNQPPKGLLDFDTGIAPPVYQIPPPAQRPRIYI